jgi:hypothetical protein
MTATPCGPSADARAPAATHRLLRRAFVALALTNLALGALLFAAVPAWRRHFVAEDHLVENLSAGLLVAAFLFGLLAALAPRSRREMPWSALGIPFLGLLGFLDETSFLGLLAGADNPHSSGAAAAESPLVLPGGYVIDGVHDFFTLPFKIWRDATGFSGYILGSLLLGGALAALFLGRRRYMPWIMGWIRRYPAFDFLRFAVVLILAAMVLDLLAAGAWLSFLEEALELNGALALACAGAAMRLGQVEGEGAARPQSPSESA